MKKNCICLSCKNLERDFIPNGKVKCLFQIETDETIGGALLKGETDKCPFDFYEKKYENTDVFDMDLLIPFYANKPPKDMPSYDCRSCSHYKNHSCPAFPEGIPSEIVNLYGHKEKLPGQNTDLVYEWDKES